MLPQNADRPLQQPHTPEKVTPEKATPEKAKTGLNKHLNFNARKGPERECTRKGPARELEWTHSTRGRNKFRTRKGPAREQTRKGPVREQIPKGTQIKFSHSIFLISAKLRSRGRGT